MPVEYLEPGQIAKPFSGLCIVTHRHFSPADFLFWIPCNFGTQRLAYQLPAQAMPKHGDIEPDCVPYQTQHRSNPWQIIIHAHGAAHQNHTAESGNGIRNRFAFIDFYQLPGNGMFIKHRSEKTWPLYCSMAENNDRLHMAPNQLTIFHWPGEIGRAHV